MRSAMRLAILTVAALAFLPGRAIACPPAVAGEAEAAFRETLDLWKDKAYEALYGRGYLEHQVALPLNDFVRLMRREDRVLQCCWLTLRHVQLACDGGYVYLKATIGYEVAGYLFDAARRAWARDFAPREVEETWRLVWQAGAYRVDLYQVLGPSYLYYERYPGPDRRFDFPLPRITTPRRR